MVVITGMKANGEQFSKEVDEKEEIITIKDAELVSLDLSP